MLDLGASNKLFGHMPPLVNLYIQRGKPARLMRIVIWNTTAGTNQKMMLLAIARNVLKCIPKMWELHLVTKTKLVIHSNTIFKKICNTDDSASQVCQLLMLLITQWNVLRLMSSEPTWIHILQNKTWFNSNVLSHRQRDWNLTLSKVHASIIIKIPMEMNNWSIKSIVNAHWWKKSWLLRHKVWRQIHHFTIKLMRALNQFQEWRLIKGMDTALFHPN